MRSRLKFVFLLATFTAVCILLFQTYWALNSYRMSRAILREQVGSVLQNSIYNYRLNLVHLPRSLQNEKPTLSVLMRMEKSRHRSNGIGLKDRLRGQEVTMALEDLKIPGEDIAAVNRMLAKLLKVSPGEKLNLTVLSKGFQSELRKRNIRLHYKLAIDPAGAPVSSAIEIAGKRYLIGAKGENETAYLLGKNAQPISISLLLVLLTAGCLIYMGAMMKRQLLLDDLKNNFITNLSHEFRTPIAALQSTHEALVDFDQLHDPVKTRQYLLMNRQILTRLNKNVDHLLETSRLSRQITLPDSDQRTLGSIITEVAALFLQDGRNNIGVTLNDDLHHMSVNAYAVETILSNLIDNAIKYSPEPAEVKIAARRSKHSWELVVSDNGHGIAPKYQPFLFDRFFRVPQGDLHDVKGYGLGLSYVHELVRLLKGKIRLSSSPGTGTSFTIQLPYA